MNLARMQSLSHKNIFKSDNHKTAIQCVNNCKLPFRGKKPFLSSRTGSLALFGHSMFYPCFATNLPSLYQALPKQMGARHASSAKGISSTYVLRPINICSTSHQHIFYASSTYVLLSSTYLLRLIYVSSTSHLRYIYEGSTSHLRGINVSSTRDFEEKRKYVPPES